MDLTRKRFISGADYEMPPMKIPPLTAAVASERVISELFICLGNMDPSQRGFLLADLLMKIQLLKQQQDLVDRPKPQLSNYDQSYYQQALQFQLQQHQQQRQQQPQQITIQTPLGMYDANNESPESQRRDSFTNLKRPITPPPPPPPPPKPDSQPTPPKQALVHHTPAPMEYTESDALKVVQQQLMFQSLSKMMSKDGSAMVGIPPPALSSPQKPPPPPPLPTVATVPTAPILAPEKVPVATPLKPAKPPKPADSSLQKTLKEEQRKVLQIIEAAHGGNVSKEEIADYLKHPVILLKENGIVKSFRNPFFTLDVTGAPNLNFLNLYPPSAESAKSEPTQKAAAPSISTPVQVTPVAANTPKKAKAPKKSPVTTPVVAVPKKSPTTPASAPAPPVLFPQTSKLIPPPLPRKAFKMPEVRPCNQWSVVTMSLPLK